MSKVNRRKEIKQKEDLLAKFRLLSSQTDTKVAGWLSSLVKDKEEDADSNTIQKDSFLNLPIIQNGVSLSAQFKNDHINTIRDLVDSKDIKNLKKQEVNGRQSDSKALNSLMNKMRDSKRSLIKDKYSSKQPSSNKIHKSSTSKNKINKNFNNKQEHTGMDGDRGSESEDDEALAKKRTVKKGSGLSFSTNKKKGSARPF